MTNTYAEITDRIIRLLEAGVIPWRKPWTSGAPKNLHSGKPYRGINALVLASTPYAAPYWLTFNQARERGGFVRKGEHGWPIIFWSMREIETDDGDLETVPSLRRWTVFNVEQCEGVDYPRPALRTLDTLDEAERIVTAMPTAPTITHGGQQAFYVPALDRVQMPPRDTFDAEPEYYSVLFHELAHSTGHPSRLNRPDVMSPKFGSEPYAKEELVAEMTAAMLCGESGIAPLTLTNSAAYIASWLKALRDDKRLLILAAGSAQKAADYILDRQREEEAA